MNILEMVNENMKFYRADNEIKIPIPAWQYWALSPDVAAAYLLKGKKHLLEAEVNIGNMRILNLTGCNAHEMLMLEVWSGINSDEYQFIWHVWEKSETARKILAEKYDMIIYEEEYPHDSIAVVFTRPVEAVITERNDLAIDHYCNILHHIINNMIELIGRYEQSGGIIKEITASDPFDNAYPSRIASIIDRFIHEWILEGRDTEMLRMLAKDIKIYHELLIKQTRIKPLE